MTDEIIRKKIELADMLIGNLNYVEQQNPNLKVVSLATTSDTLNLAREIRAAEAA